MSATLIGRFQPFHLAHEALVRRIAADYGHVTLLLGGANLSRRITDPFTWEERRALILAACPDLDLTILPLEDYPYDDARWVARVRSKQDGPLCVVRKPGDRSTYYADLFGEARAYPAEEFAKLNATDVRASYFAQDPVAGINLAVASLLSDWQKRPEFHAMCLEYDAIDDARVGYGRPDRGPVALCADAVVVAGGNVLLVTRKGPYGAGLLALPGGHVEQGETTAAAASRELREETGVNLPAVGAPSWFDHPKRDLRCRVVTAAYRFDLPEPVPAVGADDAAHADWYALASLDPRRCFADHAFILNAMTGLNPLEIK